MSLALVCGWVLTDSMEELDESSLLMFLFAGVSLHLRLLGTGGMGVAVRVEEAMSGIPGRQPLLQWLRPRDPGPKSMDLG